MPMAADGQFYSARASTRRQKQGNLVLFKKNQGAVWVTERKSTLVWTFTARPRRVAQTRDVVD